MTRIRPERGVFLTVGVPNDRPEYWLQRALDVLHRTGFQAGLTSDEAVLAAAELIEEDVEERPTA